MSQTTARVIGSHEFSEVQSSIPISSEADIDQALALLDAKKDEWANLPPGDVVTMLDHLKDELFAQAGSMVEATMRNQQILPGTYHAGTLWLEFNPALNMIVALRQTLHDIDQTGQPGIVRRLVVGRHGQVVARVFPLNMQDRLYLPTYQGEVWIDPDLTRDEVIQGIAPRYQPGTHTGAVTLVLGGGNTPAVVFSDLFHWLFVERHVVVLKPNPVNAYLGPFFENIFAPLIDRGYLRLIYGGRAEGQLLADHPKVDTIHMTGSDKTFESVVFGPGPDGARRKASRQPRITKPVTGELGNVSPIIVVPGPWTQEEIDTQALYIASWMVTWAACACATPRVVIQHADWAHRQPLIDALRQTLDEAETRFPYYPGAAERFSSFVDSHTQAELLSQPGDEHLHWALIPDVGSNQTDNISFTTEPFCGVLSETALEADNVVDYIKRAVAFANDTLWGTLTATILVHPKSLKHPEVAAAVEQAIHDLNYGTVALNCWGLVGFMLGCLPWGGAPGSDIYDVQSGIGWTGNSYMLPRPVKSVIRKPFMTPVKPDIHTNDHFREVARSQLLYRHSPTLLNLWRYLRSAFR